MKIRIRYVVKENRKIDYYDVGQVWLADFPKKSIYKIVWNKWFFNRILVLFILKSITEREYYENRGIVE